jgi:hypothetical protein
MGESHNQSFQPSLNRFARVDFQGRLNTLKLLRGNLSKLVPLGASLLWPPNAVVAAANALSLIQGQPWLDYVQRHSAHGVNLDQLIESSLRWLTHSQDRVGSGGVGCYEFYRWTRGYPEVTGYIIPTFWDSYNTFHRQELADRAIRMAEWEIGCQRPDGGFEGSYEGDGQSSVVFNTGQVIRGLVRTMEETGEQRFLDAAIRAGNWIVESQEADGSWARNNYRNMKRVYDSYVAAPLAKLARMTGEEHFANAAVKNCDFALKHQHPNGWFELCDNTRYKNDAPITHTICYTVDGLIETGELLDKPEFIEAGRKTAEKLMDLVESSSRLRGRFDENWRPRSGFVCVTGCAQLGIILMNLYRRSGDPKYLDVSLKLVDFLAYVQNLNSWGKNRRGGLTGAYPVWGMYCPMKYPSWASKFFIDLLLLVRKSSLTAC